MLGLFFLAILAVIVIGRPFSDKPQMKFYDGLGQVVGFATLAVSLLVWFGDQRTRWEQSLPKLLTVVYLYDGRPAMKCVHATLLGEADVRAMSQQMGAQITGVRHLAISPVFELKSTEIIQQESAPKMAVLYTVHMTLTEVPDKIVDARRQGKPHGVLVRQVTAGKFTDSFV